MNIPNFITMLRVFLIPLFLYLVFHHDTSMKIAALAVFCIASFTDLIDGWSARKLGLESELGKFLDPLADKFLVIATLIAFVFLDPLVPMWMILVIVSRDILITLIRFLAIRKGCSIRTSKFGKVKTAFQMVSILVIIAIFIVRSAGIDISSALSGKSVIEITMSDISDKWLIVGPYWIMMIVTVMTAISGVRYLITNWRVFLPPYKKVSR